MRAPIEYEAGALVDAQNLPLLNNDNRKAIGICYKQRGKDAAIALGYQLINPLRDSFLEQLKQYTADKEIKLYCARGGLRSHKMAEFLSESGYTVHLLKGGYKAYRNIVINRLSAFKNIFILSGYTGCDKTGILEQLRIKGEQVLNLEALAHHKGSAFGALGETPQPSNAQFSNLIFDALKEYDFNNRLWVESESISIGKVAIPLEFWYNMLNANGIEIVLPIEKRVNFIVENYGQYDKMQLIAAIEKISKRLGGQETTELCEKTTKGELHQVVMRLLKYYDKAYEGSRLKRNCQNYVKFNLDCIDPVMNSEKILQHLQE